MGYSLNKPATTKFLFCLSEYFTWLIPFIFHLPGIEEFDNQIENEKFTGRPKITICRMTEENVVVVADRNVKKQNEIRGSSKRSVL